MLTGSRKHIPTLYMTHILTSCSIPFFFEPNYDALVEPLAAISRSEEYATLGNDPTADKYKPTIYGQFLMKKVGNNFAEGKGKYD